MLRINRIENGTELTLELEGKLLAPWVAEVKAACGIWPGDRLLRLDLGSVSFVDEAGAQLLTTLLGQGASLVACSNFVAELLHRERP